MRYALCTATAVRYDLCTATAVRCDLCTATAVRYDLCTATAVRYDLCTNWLYLWFPLFVLFYVAAIKETEHSCLLCSDY